MGTQAPSIGRPRSHCLDPDRGRGDVAGHVRGFPTRWFSLAAVKSGSHIEVDTTERWLAQHLPTLPADPDLADWLAAPQQHLLQLTAGQVFRDDLGVLTHRRQTYAWYGDDVWRWLLASQWHLIGNTEPLLGRTIDSGDRRGARLLTARLCQLVMEMAYLQQRRYQPYSEMVQCRIPAPGARPHPRASGRRRARPGANATPGRTPPAGTPGPRRRTQRP